MGRLRRRPLNKLLYVKRQAAGLGCSPSWMAVVWAWCGCDCIAQHNTIIKQLQLLLYHVTMWCFSLNGWLGGGLRAVGGVLLSAQSRQQLAASMCSAVTCAASCQPTSQSCLSIKTIAHSVLKPTKLIKQTSSNPASFAADVPLAKCAPRLACAAMQTTFQQKTRKGETQQTVKITKYSPKQLQYTTPATQRQTSNHMPCCAAQRPTNAGLMHYQCSVFCVDSPS